jgi:hypothetical protein
MKLRTAKRGRYSVKARLVKRPKGRFSDDAQSKPYEIEESILHLQQLTISLGRMLGLRPGE